MVKETTINEFGKRVPVPEDQAVHEQYDKFLIRKLKTMSDRMLGWSNVCPFCFEGDKKKEKLQPSVRINEALDRLSTIAMNKITGSRESWTLFISSLAWIYHEEVCTHEKVTEDESEDL